MSRALWSLLLSEALLFCVALGGVAWAQIAKDAPPAKPSAAATKLLENPDDVAAYTAYMNELMRDMAPLSRTPAAAQARLDAADQLIAKLKPTQSDAMMRLSMLKSSVDGNRNRLAVQNVPLAELEQKLVANPDDAQALKLYTTKLSSEVFSLSRAEPAAAEKLLAKAKEVLTPIRAAAASEALKRQLRSTDVTITSLERAVETGRLTLAELGDKLKQNPNDSRALNEFFSKVTAEIPALARSKPAEAAAKIELARGIFKEVRASSTNKSIATMIGSFERSLDSLSRMTESGKKLAELIGKDAAPLAVERWANGSPLKDEDLKGKVVLLDFWAVWCGPCIATFPHLREWNEKYADKGLVMIGLTRYYNYRWDEDTNKAARATEKVPPDEELAMLEKFAEQHDLHHRFAVQAGSDLTDFYGVSGIPHVVVIDRQGKVRMMKVGSGEANAKEIGALLDQLLGK